MPTMLGNPEPYALASGDYEEDVVTSATRG